MLISIIPPKTPHFSISSLFSAPTFYRIHRPTPFLVAGNSRSSRRKPRRKRLEADMSVSIPVPPVTTHRRDKDDDPFSVSANDSREGDFLTAEAENEASSSKLLVKRKIKSKSWFSCFGVDMSPDTIAVAMVYFVQGVLGLSRLAVSFYLKDDLHLDPAELSYLGSLHSHGLLSLFTDL